MEIGTCDYRIVCSFTTHQLYFTIIVEIGKTRIPNFHTISRFGRRVSTQFLVFPIPTRVDITVYQHGKCFIFVKYSLIENWLSRVSECPSYSRFPDS
jgi:hypothetical protein